MIRIKPFFILFLALITGITFGFSSCEPIPEEEINPVEDITFYNGSEKLWKHRVNNVDSANFYLQYFAGLELDVFFDQGKFYVAHDSDYLKSETITLEEYFSQINNVADSKYWIDFKNLDRLNKFRARDRLLDLVSNYDLLKNVIVESRDEKSLRIFNKSGIFTSFWTPTIEGYSGEITKEVEEVKKEIENELKHCKHNALSGPYQMAGFYKDFFSDQNIHIWTNGLITEEDKQVVSQFKTITPIKVILIDYNRPF